MCVVARNSYLCSAALSALTGRYYRLCIDADGTTFPQIPGDTGVTVTWTTGALLLTVSTSLLSLIET